jgi:predicted esterase
MAANVVYTFESIAPGQTTSVFLHGYGDRDAVSYSAVIYNQPGPGVLFPQAHVILTQGETFRWAVDGTIGRKIYIANQDPFSSVGVDILQIVESF